MAENQTTSTPTKSKKDLIGERLKKRYPDKEYPDDESMFGQIDEDYEDYENQLNGYRDRESRLNDLLTKDPKSAQFLTDLAKGNDPWLAVIERLGIDGITDLMNDPSKQSEYAEANKKYVERIAKEKSLEEEYERNFSESMALLDEIQRESNLSDDIMDAAYDLVVKIAHEAILGKFTRETIDMALNAINHDADVENARTEGTIAGRNAKIAEKLRKRDGGDGVPVLGGKNNGGSQGKRNLTVFDYAEAAS